MKAADLARRAAQLEAIFNNAVDAIITIDEQGFIDSVNPATEKLFGYTPKDLIGKNVNMLMPSPFHEEHEDYLTNYLRTGERRIIGLGRDVVGKRKDGTTFPMELAVSEALVGGDRLFTGIVRDISERKSAEQQQASVGRIIEESLNEIYIFDAKTLRFVQVNRGARENLGYTMEELRELTLSSIKPGHTAEKFAAAIETLVSGEKKKIEFETVHQRKDGTLYDVEVHLQKSVHKGSPVFVAIILDITERKRAETLLRIQERALEAASSGILITDPNQQDNPIIICNRAFFELTGYSAEEVIGHNCRFLQRGDRDQEAIDVLRQAIKEERECRVVLRNYRKDGSMFWNELRVSPVRDAQGSLTHFVGVQTDMTDQKQNEEELERLVRERTEELGKAQEELLKKEKLATLGQVSGGIAHEIRNPLNAIKTSTYFLLNAKTPIPEKVAEHLDRIDRQVTLIDNVITALTDVARLPEPKLQATPVGHWLQEAVQAVAMPGSIETSLELPLELPAVLVDKNQIPIVLKNLLRNARDAMPTGGKLTISAHAANQHVSITVTDTGVGIPAQDLPRIMEPLYSTKARGMGLGLAISQAIVEKNDGVLSVESTEGTGTTFTIRLKAAGEL